jgi:dephospho-CoA kinase
MTGENCTSLILGITGGLACGKSEVGRNLEKIGFTVCDTDHVAHDLMKKGQSVYDQVVHYFGTTILVDGEISRPILGEIIFKNPAERDALNQRVHPAVQAYLKDWIRTARKNHENAAALVPLLFESGMNELDWDAILCVSSHREQVFERLKNRGLTKEESILRVESQMSVEQKVQRSDDGILNIGTLRELEQFTRETVKRIMAEQR